MVSVLCNQHKPISLPTVQPGGEGDHRGLRFLPDAIQAGKRERKIGGNLDHLDHVLFMFEES